MTSTSYENRLLRHCSITASRIPTSEELRVLLPIIKKSASRARFKFRTVFDTMGLGSDDLINLGLTHSIFFLDRYGRDKNDGLLHCYLNQRFAEAAKITADKIKNCSAVTDGYLGDTDLIQDPGPGADEAYANGCFQLYRGSDSHFLEICGTESLTPIIYIDGVRLTDAEIMGIRDELDTGISTIVAIEVEYCPNKDQETALAYVALSPDINKEIRSAAIRVCRKRFGIKYKILKPKFQELQDRVRVQGLLPNDFERLNVRPLPRWSRNDDDDQRAALRKQLIQDTPASRYCHRCQALKDVKEFSIKIMRSVSTGEPQRAIFCSYCKTCKHEINRKKGN